MKQILLMFMLAVFLFSCAVEVPQWQTGKEMEPRNKVRHYDQEGRYKGYDVVGPRSTRHYDKDGRFIGTSK